MTWGMKKGTKKIVCYWEKGSSACSIGKKYEPLEVRAKTYKKTITEREDEGGGWYGSRTEKSRVDVTDYLAYYNDHLIGEISMYNPMFSDPNKWHMIVSVTVKLPLLKNQTI